MSNSNTISRVDSPKITHERKSRNFDPPQPRGNNGRRIGTLIDPKQQSSDEEAFLGRYLIEDVDFAKGAYGRVSLATDRSTQQRVVIKRIPKSTPYRMIENEARCGALIGSSHSNIAAFHQYQALQDQYCMVFQYVDGCDLFTFLEDSHFTPQPEHHTRILFSAVLSAVQFCHSKSIAHRDIKLENILVDRSGTPFLIDFGLSTIVDSSSKKCRDWLGSDNYLAPEIVRRTPYDSFQSDVWSLGVTLFALLFGVFPFENMRVNSPYSNNPKNPLPRLRARFPTDVNVSREAKEIILGMLEDDPDRRMTIDDIIQHEWISGRRSMTKLSNE